MLMPVAVASSPQEGVVNKEQAQAVQCMCRNLRWASSIMPAYSINGSTSGDSEQEE